LNASTKAMILELANNGTSIREIAARLALKRSRVGSVCKQRLPDAKMNRGGRPAKLSLSDKRYCVRSICRDPKANATTVARSLREQFDIVVTPQTVRRNLRAEGMAAVEKNQEAYSGKSATQESVAVCQSAPVLDQGKLAACYMD
jgi:transposase